MSKSLQFEEALKYLRAKGMVISDEEFEKLYMEGGGPPFFLESPQLTCIKDAISWLEETLEDLKLELYIYETKE